MHLQILSNDSFSFGILIVASTTKLTIKKTCAQNLSATIPEHEYNNRLRFVIEYCAYMLCKRNKTKHKKSHTNTHTSYNNSICIVCFVEFMSCRCSFSLFHLFCCPFFFDGNISLQSKNDMNTNTESDEPTQTIEGNMMETSEANPMFAHELI